MELAGLNYVTVRALSRQKNVNRGGHRPHCYANFNTGKTWSTFHLRAFPVAAARTWNSLPAEVTSSNSLYKPN